MKQMNDATDHLALMFVLLVGVVALVQTIEMTNEITERRRQAIERIK